MKIEKINRKFTCTCLAVTALSLVAAAGTATAFSDMEEMLAEGISYKCDKTPKCKAAQNDNRADMEALMAEGIVYQDSVIANDKVLIKLNHRELLLQSMEACMCEGLLGAPVQKR